jgi:hypothetical protein
VGASVNPDATERGRISSICRELKTNSSVVKFTPQERFRSYRVCDACSTSDALHCTTHTPIFFFIFCKEDVEKSDKKPNRKERRQYESLTK